MLPSLSPRKRLLSLMFGELQLAAELNSPGLRTLAPLVGPREDRSNFASPPRTVIISLPWGVVVSAPRIAPANESLRHDHR